MPLVGIDVTTPHLGKVQTIRATQEGAQPTQPLDSTTILHFEVRRIRDLQVAITPMDSQTRLAVEWGVSL